MEEREQALRSVKSILRSLLLPEKSGIQVDRLPRVYQEEIGKDIRLESRQLGYKNLHDFLKSIPDVITKGRNKRGEDVYMGVPDASTQHIANLVRKQKAKDKPKRPVRRPSHNSTNWNPPPQRNGGDARFGGGRGPVQGRLGGYSQNNGPPGYRGGPAPRPWSNRGGRGRFSMHNGNSGPLREPRGGYQGVPGGYGRPGPQVSSPPRNQGPPQRQNSNVKPRNQQAQRQTSSRAQPDRQQSREGAAHHKRDLKNYFSRNNLGDVPYKTSAIGTKGKERYMATVTVEGTQFKTYPQTFGSEAEAEEAVAALCVKKLGILSGSDSGGIPETSDPAVYAHRVVELIGNRLNGVWSTQIEKQYTDKYSEKLPSLWLEEVDSMDMIKVESPIPGSGRYIVFPYTPPVAHMAQPRVNNYSNGHHNIRQTGPPPLQPPSDEYWDVYITYVRQTTQVSLRFIGEEYSEKFEEMSTNMELCYYDMESIPRIKEPEVGRIYAAHVSSDWHRVKVVNVQGIHVSCSFLDHGDEDQIPVEDLRELDTKFLELPAQAYTVSLSGLEDYSDSDQVVGLLNTELLGKSLIAKVQQFVDGSSPRGELQSLILFDTSGELDVNLNKTLIEIIEGEETCRLPPIGGEEVQVFVSYVSSGGDIYVQKDSNTFERIMKIIGDSGEEFMKDGPASSLDTSQLYLAKYCEDNALYRAALLTEDIKDGKALKCRLARVPPEGYSWSQAATDFLKNMVPETQPVLLKVVGGTPECPLVELTLNGESINLEMSTDFDIFPISLGPKSCEDSNNNSSGDSGCVTPADPVEANIDTPLQPDTPPIPATPPALPQLPTGMMGDLELEQLKPLLAPVIPPAGEGNFFDVTVTLAVSPSNFVVQPYKEGQKLELLMNDLSNFYNDPSHLREMSVEQVEEGSYFSARHPDDGYWYRVRVTKVIDSENVAVRYVDYGDLSMVSLANLQPLCFQFRNLPYQAIHARLADIMPAAGDWRPEDTIWFNQRVVDQQFVSLVKGVSESATGELTLDLALIDTSEDEEDRYVDKELVQDGRASFSELPEPQ